MTEEKAKPQEGQCEHCYAVKHQKHGDSCPNNPERIAHLLEGYCKGCLMFNHGGKKDENKN